jgi:hypothetical protein
MFASLRAAAIAALFAASFAGCAPKETFSWIDRHCFVADWTNHHSCVSCCRNGGCQQAYPNVQYPMLVLGDQPEIELPVASPFADDQAVSGITEPQQPVDDRR